MTADLDQLLAAGRFDDAVQLATQRASAGDADALFMLGAWRLEGRIMQRDLAAAREFFRRAGEAGRQDSKTFYTAFVANGTGGPSDWQHALKLLRTLARKDHKAKRQLWLIEKMKLTLEGDPVKVPHGQLLCESPQVLRFEALLTPSECNYLVDAATPLFKPSVVVGDSGKQVPNPIRTSETAAFPWPLENPAVHAINRRLAAVSGTRADQGEPLQVLRYYPGQEYRPHFDAVPGLENQRQLTALIYLNDDYEGGETLFTKVGLSVRGSLGDAILFRNSDDAGVQRDDTMHAGLPVTSGLKLIASRWIRQRRLEV